MASTSLAGFMTMPKLADQGVKGDDHDPAAHHRARWWSWPRRPAATACWRSRRTSPRSTTPTPRRACSSSSTAPTPTWCATILESEIDGMAQRHHHGALNFQSACGFAPTLGILGTVMGLVRRALAPRRAVQARPAHRRRVPGHAVRRRQREPRSSCRSPTSSKEMSARGGQPPHDGAGGDPLDPGRRQPAHAGEKLESFVPPGAARQAAAEGGRRRGRGRRARAARRRRHERAAQTAGGGGRRTTAPTSAGCSPTPT